MVFRKQSFELACETYSLSSITDNFVYEKPEEFPTFLNKDIFKIFSRLAKHSIQESTENVPQLTVIYLLIKPVHPRHSIPGIIGSQPFRLRRICTQDVDFDVAIERLRSRCLNSVYVTIHCL